MLDELDTMNRKVVRRPKVRDFAADLEAVAAGNRAAFGRLYEGTAPVLFGICVRILRDREQARDALQDVMVRIWQKSHLFDRTKGDALGWMVVVARSCLFNRIADGGIAVASLDDDAVRAAAEASAVSVDPALAPDVKRCLEKLSDKYRQCVVLVHQYGLSYEELSTWMKIPTGTAKTWIHRAIGELELCLSQ